VPELEKDFGLFTELNGAAVEVDAAIGTAIIFARSSSELDSTTRLRRPG